MILENVIIYYHKINCQFFSKEIKSLVNINLKLKFFTKIILKNKFNMKTYIIGKRSNLSIELYKKIKKSKIISSEEFKNLKLESKSNLIINNFFPSSKISKLNNYNEFINLSLSNQLKH